MIDDHGFLRALAANLTTNFTTSKVEEATSSLEWYGYIAMVLLVMMSGFCSGTNIGVLGLDEAYL